MALCVKKRARYIELIRLVKNHLLSDEAAAQSYSGEQISSVHMYDEFDPDTFQAEGSGRRALTPREASELAEIELALPLETLVLFRHLAVKEISQLNREAERAKKLRMRQAGLLNEASSSAGGVAVGGAQSQRTWAEWIGGGGPSSGSQGDLAAIKFDEEESRANSARHILTDEDVSMEEMQSKLMEAFENDFKSSAYILKLGIECDVVLSLALQDNSQRLLTSAITVTVSTSLHSDCKKFSIAVNDAAIIDEFTKPRPLIRHILLWSNKHVDKVPASPGSETGAVAAPPSFIICYEKQKGKKYSISAKAASIEMCFNSKCIQELLGYFSMPSQLLDSLARFPRSHAKKVPESQAAFQRLRTRLRAMQKPAGDGAHGVGGVMASGPDLSTSSDIEFTFEADSPKIIIPESSSHDKGYLLLDTGRLSLSVALNQQGKMCNLDISNIHAALPDTLSSFYVPTSGGSHVVDCSPSLYILKPFSVNASFQDIEQTYASTSLSVDITPHIYCEIQCSKLNRVLDCLAVLSGTFSAAPQAAAAATATLADMSKKFVEHRHNTSSAIPAPPPSHPSDRVLYRKGETPLHVRKQNTDGTRVSARSSSCGTSSDPSPPPGALGHGVGSTASVSSLGGGGGSGFSGPDAAEALFANMRLMHMTVHIPMLTLLVHMHTSVENNPTYPNNKLVGSNANNNMPYQLKFSLSPLHCEITSRNYDFNISLSFDHIVIEDSLRVGKQHFLALVPNDDGEVAEESQSSAGVGTGGIAGVDKSQDPHLLLISFSAIKDRKSPLFKGFGTEMVVNFAKIHFNIDAKSVLHLRPLIEVFLRRKAIAALAKTNAAPVAQAAPTSSDAIEGMHIHITIEEISIDCYRDPSLAEEEEHFRRSMLATELEKTGQVSTDPHGKCSVGHEGHPCFEQEVAFSLYVTDLRAHLQLEKLVSAYVNLKSVTIVDQRRESEDYVVRTVFCPQSAIKLFSKDLKQHTPARSQSQGQLSGNEKGRALSGKTIERTASGIVLDDDMQCNIEARSDSCASTSPTPSQGRVRGGRDETDKAAAAQQPDILYVEYRQHGNNITSFDILVEGVACYVTVNTIIDMASVLTANTYSILDLLVTPQVSAPQALSISVAPVSVPIADNGGADETWHDTNSAGAEGTAPDTPPDENNEYYNRKSKKDSTIKLSLLIPNPRILLLDDPSIANDQSEAIVGICQSMDISFSRAYYHGKKAVHCGSKAMHQSDWEEDELLEIRESLLVGVSKQELFVIHNVMEWVPQQILEPVDVHFHYNRRIEQDVVYMMDLRFDLDNVHMRVSLSDLMLAQSILTQATSSQKNQPHVAKPGAVAVTQPSNMSKKVTVYTFSATVGSVDTILVNDFAGQNTPFLRSIVHGSSLSLSGPMEGLYGECSFYFSAEFCHPLTFVWEPFVEKFMAEIELSSTTAEVVANVTVDKTLQLTTTGIMLETLLHTYSLLVGIDEGASSTKYALKRDIVPQYLIKNYLGDNMDLRVIEPDVRRIMFTVPADVDNSSELEDKKSVCYHASSPVYAHSTQLALANPMAKKHMLSADQKAINMHILGRCQGEWLPLTRLPLGANKRRLYYLQPAGRSSRSHHDALARPMIEEIFENQRYDPLTGVWKKPYFTGDPFAFSDINGIVDKEKCWTQIPAVAGSDLEWEWQSQWDVDISTLGIVTSNCDGEEHGQSHSASGTSKSGGSTTGNAKNGSAGKTADKAEATSATSIEGPGINLSASRSDGGFVYASSFKLMNSMHRKHRSLDMVRRRRWIRARAPKPLPLHDPVRPLIIVWDVIPQRDGAKLIEIRSTVQIRNYLPYPICVALFNSAWEKDAEFLDIMPDSVFHVPLLYAYATKLRMRPGEAFGPVEFSEYVPCSLHTQDYYQTRDLSCAPLAAAESDAEGDLTIRCKSILEQTGGSIVVSFQPYVRVLNTLFSDLQYMCSSGSRAMEEGHIVPAKSTVLSYASTNDPKMNVAFRVGGYSWSAPQTLVIAEENNGFDAETREKTIEFCDSSGEPALVLTMKYKYCTFADVILKTTNGTRANDSNTNVGYRDSAAGEFSSPTASYNSVLEIQVFSRGAIIDRSGLRASIKCLRSADRSSALTRNTFATSSSEFTIQQLQRENFFNTRLSPEEVSLDNYTVTSNLSYNIVRRDLNTVVYSDAQHDHMFTPQYEHERAWKWSYLPYYMRGGTFVQTPNADRHRRKENLIRFSVSSSPVVVMVLVDITFGRTEPKWLSSRASPHGFQLLPDTAMARRQRAKTDGMSASGATFDEMVYKIYGRLYAANEEVELNGNWSKSRSGNMFAVCVLAIVEGAESPPPSPMGPNQGSSGSLTDRATGNSSNSNNDRYYDGVLDKVLFPMAFGLQSGGESWVGGNNGLAYYHSMDNKMSVGLHKGQLWSDELAISALPQGSTGGGSGGSSQGSSSSSSGGEAGNMSKNPVKSAPLVAKGTFEVVDWDTKTAYQLMIMTEERLSGVFCNTTLLTVIPLFTIVNCLDQALHVRQMGASTESPKPGAAATSSCIPPCHSAAWHKLNVNLSTRLQFRVGSDVTMWSIGNVDISEIGSASLYIPYMRSNVLCKDRGVGAGVELVQPYVIRVQVRLAENSEMSGIYVVVFREEISTNMMLSVKNECDLPVVVRQPNVPMMSVYGLPEDSFDVTIPPFSWVPFGWIDPGAAEHILHLYVDEPPPSSTSGDGNISGHSGGPPSPARKETATRKVRPVAVLNADGTVASYVRLADGSGRKGYKGEAVVGIMPYGGHANGRILKIQSAVDFNEASAMRSETEGATTEEGAFQLQKWSYEASRHGPLGKFALNVAFKTVGLSLSVDRPTRRELLSVYCGGIGVMYSCVTKAPSVQAAESVTADGVIGMQSVDLWVDSVQVDNYCESAIYPVMLIKVPALSASVEAAESARAAPTGRTRAADNAHNIPSAPFVRLKATKELMDSKSTSLLMHHQPVVKLLQCHLSDFIFEIDSATIEVLFEDCLGHLHYISPAQSRALLTPTEWIENFTYDAHLGCCNVNNVAIEAGLLKKSINVSRFYFEHFSVSPMKIIISFVQTPFPRRKVRRNGELEGSTVVSTLMNVLKSFASVDRMQLKLTPFLCRNSPESVESLTAMLMAKSIHDIQLQLPQIAGSLNVIGNPLLFARGVGMGLHAFINEPYQGLAKNSPSQFIHGVGKGTSGLVGGVVSGTLNSGAAIVDTASRGISYLSGDAEYVRQRALDRQKLKASRTGVVGGLVDGTENIVAGFASGISGLFTKPVEEGSKSGAVGFFKGVGLGLLGAAIKPVLGVSDGLSSVAQGISNQITSSDAGNSIALQIRPPRALMRWAVDLNTRVLTPLDLDAGYGQKFVLDRRRLYGGYEDAFVAYSSLAEPGHSLIISEKYLYWRRGAKLWGRRWTNISHIALLHADPSVVASGPVTAVATRASAVPGVAVVRVSSAAMPAPTKVVPPPPSPPPPPCCIRVYLYNGERHVDIICGSVELSRQVYAKIERQAHRMGFPDWVAALESLKAIPGSSAGACKAAAAEDRRARSKYQDDSEEEATQSEDEYISRSDAAAEEHLARARLHSGGLGDRSVTIDRATGELNGYIFGSVNGSPLGLAPSKHPTGRGQGQAHAPVSSSEAISMAQHRLINNYDSLKTLDHIAWSLAAQWDTTHVGLQASACCVTVILNESDVPVQVHRVQLIEGCNVDILGSGRFDAGSRTLYPQGVVLVFAWAHSPSPMNEGHVKVTVATTACSATVASNQNDSRMIGEPGFVVGFLEKTVSQWWSKYVVLIST